MTKGIAILPLHHFLKAATYPFRNWRRYRIAYSVIAKAVDPIRLLRIEPVRLRPVIGKALHPLNFIRREAAHAPFRIPNVISRPIRSRMPSGFGIDAMGDALYEGSFASISKDCLKDGGRFLPIRSTLLRIPVAAFWLKKYFSCTSCVSMHGNNVDSTALLGDSEVFTVKHTPRDAIPEFVQRLEYDGEVASSVAREKAVHVFEDNCSWKTSSNESHKVVKEARLVPSKPRSRPHSSKREVLAGESCRPDISFRDICVI
ncbi:MAG TPA: hypothetical protein VF617_03830 [Sphingomonas sp.]